MHRWLIAQTLPNKMYIIEKDFLSNILIELFKKIFSFFLDKGLTFFWQNFNYC